MIAKDKYSLMSLNSKWRELKVQILSVGLCRALTNKGWWLQITMYMLSASDLHTWDDVVRQDQGRWNMKYIVVQ